MTVVRELAKSITPEFVFDRLAAKPYRIWFDSALRNDKLGRYSFVAADPVDVLRIERPSADPFAALERRLTTIKSPRIAGLPPFQGGFAGYLGYELGRCFERIPAPRHNELAVPLAVLGLYDVVFAWDHVEQEGWLISRGFSKEKGVPTEAALAAKRADDFLQAITQPRDDTHQAAEIDFRLHAMAHGLTAPQFETKLGDGWLGNFDSDGYREAVLKAIEYIYAGDIFQVNLSHRLLCPAKCDSSTLYKRLRSVNAAPFAGFFDIHDAQIISASPERFVQIQDGWIETRPIKGTRRRTGDPHKDAALAKDLCESAKDRAENIMIVDLLRNDLSKISDPSSLVVNELCEIEAYPYVLHMVSAIRSKLRRDVTFTDLVSAIFPGGSITGAPKVRAMEIIAELESTARGPYCGSLGYHSVDGSMDWNILIRTLTASHGWWQFQVGGGIVADSVPELEEEETWTKAAGIVKAIQAPIG